MQTLSDLIAATESPLGLGQLWDDETNSQIMDLVNSASKEAQRRGMPEGPGMLAVLTGLYAHGFMVGRRHLLLGLPLPGGDDVLTADDIPDDLSSLETP